jgi:hypothetical protein
MTTQNTRPSVATRTDTRPDLSGNPAGTILVDAGGVLAEYWPNAHEHFTCLSEFTQLYDAWRARVGRVEGPVDAVMKQLLLGVARTLTAGTNDRAVFARISALSGLAFQMANPPASSVEGAAEAAAVGMAQAAALDDAIMNERVKDMAALLAPDMSKSTSPDANKGA